MAYEKRLCVLKQIKKGFSVDGSALSGAVYAERMGQEVIITPKIGTLAPLREGRYALALWIGGLTYCLELRGNEPLRIPETNSLKSGFSALVCFVRGDVEALAYGFCGGAPTDYAPLLQVFERKEKATPNARVRNEKSREVQENENCLSGGKDEEVTARELQKSDPVSTKTDPISPKQDDGGAKYDDEAIADADYFGGVWEALEDAGVASEVKNEEPKAEKRGCSCADETDEAVHPFSIPRGGLAYYNEIAPKLKEALKKYPRDEHLMQTFPNSEWVKAENALLGIIYAEGAPRYLCVAMKSKPPKEVEDCSIFVPEGPYSETEGYYVVFQDADTGDYVRIEEA